MQVQIVQLIVPFIIKQMNCENNKLSPLLSAQDLFKDLDIQFMPLINQNNLILDLQTPIKQGNGSIHPHLNGNQPGDQLLSKLVKDDLAPDQKPYINLISRLHQDKRQSQVDSTDLQMNQKYGKLQENPYFKKLSKKKSGQNSQISQQLNVKSLKQKIQRQRNHAISYLIQGPQNPELLICFKDWSKKIQMVKQQQKRSSKKNQQEPQKKTKSELDFKKSHQYFFSCLAILQINGFTSNQVEQVYEDVKNYREDKRLKEYSQDQMAAIQIQVAFTRSLIYQFYHGSKQQAIKNAYYRNVSQINNHRLSLGLKSTFRTVNMILGEEYSFE